MRRKTDFLSLAMHEPEENARKCSGGDDREKEET